MKYLRKSQTCEFAIVAGAPSCSSRMISFRRSARSMVGVPPVAGILSHGMSGSGEIWMYSMSYGAR